ncbi:uncharacterized protein LOC141691791 [Apium graveolens]|uniref:uncharacterized protein LOC141691791 n=1 Tax=Apium graveolens TaxID=4045 RepID=UPI003D7933C2
MAEENIQHVVWYCPVATRCWEELSIHFHADGNGNILQLLASIFDTRSIKEIEKFCMVAWNLWSHRNGVVWKGLFQSPGRIIQVACDMLEQWQKAQEVKSKVSCTKSAGISRWRRLHAGWLSCNVDTAVFKDNSLSSFGCLLRDEHGSFIAAIGGVWMGAFEPKVAEAMAFREALSWVKERRATNIVFQLDSQLVVNAMKLKSKVNSYFGDIIEECSSIIKDLRSYSIRFVRRSANIAAHTIAREASSVSDCVEWTSVPHFLSGVLSHDLN